MNEFGFPQNPSQRFIIHSFIQVERQKPRRFNYTLRIKITINNDFKTVKSICAELSSDNILDDKLDIIGQRAPISERDIMAEVYCRFKDF